jgi:hypothetical protein
VNAGLLALATPREVQEMDITLLLELPSWLEDECEFDIMNLTRLATLSNLVIFKGILGNGVVTAEKFVSVPRGPGFDSRCYQILGARHSIVVKVLCYKPEGRGFETR